MTKKTNIQRCQGESGEGSGVHEHYEILGDLYAGEETPCFRAVLFSMGVAVVRLDSAGTGGCARLEWLHDSQDMREQVKRWLFSEAVRLWPREYGPPPFDLLALPHEAAILVVPEHIGAPMTARFRTSAMPPGSSVDLRLLLEANLDPNVQRTLRHLDVGADVVCGTLKIERLS